MRILLVEDDRLLGSATRHSLKQDGFRVDWATDGNAASAATKTQRYDVIVLDLGLPGVRAISYCAHGARIASAHRSSF